MSLMTALWTIRLLENLALLALYPLTFCFYLSWMRSFHAR